METSTAVPPSVDGLSAVPWPKFRITTVAVNRVPTATWPGENVTLSITRSGTPVVAVKMSVAGATPPGPLSAIAKVFTKADIACVKVSGRLTTNVNTPDWRAPRLPTDNAYVLPPTSVQGLEPLGM